MTRKKYIKLALSIAIVFSLTASSWQTSYTLLSSQDNTVDVVTHATQNTTKIETKVDKAKKIETKVGTVKKVETKVDVVKKADIKVDTSKVDPNSKNNIVLKELEFTLESLKTYNGQNNNPAYIAVKGLVYDVTKIGNWSNGTHKGYKAGQDLTLAFSKSPHSISILKNVPVVGKLVLIESPVNVATKKDVVKTEIQTTKVNYKDDKKDKEYNYHEKEDHDDDDHDGDRYDDEHGDRDDDHDDHDDDDEHDDND